ncbi:MAG: N-acetylmuramoyl-L-alanine amidase [Herpetosiphonaceae bacterium]|nr:N-acetylmuramoyl-L-alanine amidase [Herpetosiphonaceae bacterium]
MQFNTSYLNLTPNKTARSTRAFKPEFVVMHETAGYGSLQWNLKPEVRSSYNYLISRTGTVYHYVDEKAFIAWHAGISSAARGYTGGQLNVYAIGVELEGPNDSTPITTAQTKAMVELLRFFRETYGIPLTRQYYFAHKDVAPSHKSDPRGYSVEYTLKIISDSEPAPTTRPNTLGAQLRNEVYKLAGGEYRPDWRFHQVARENKLGSPIKVGMDFTTKGVRYTGEVYGRDVIISPYEQWNIVLSANELTDNEVYTDLMRFTYGALGVDFRPEQAFYRFISQTPRKPVGVPLDDSIRLQARDGAAYATQLYTFETLYTPITAGGGSTDWSVVRQLSSVLAAQNINAADAALRDVINETMYMRINDRFVPEFPFIKKALELKFGAPLTTKREWTFKGKTYVYQVYAGDTLYAVKGDLTTLKRLSQTAD